MATNGKANGGVIARPGRQEALAQYPDLIMAVPAGEDDDGSGIVADILAVDDIADLIGDTSASLPSGEDVIGRKLRLHRIERREGTEGALGWYLVIQSTDEETGEVVRWQTSAMSVMAKLVKLHQLTGNQGRVSALVEVSRSEKATKANRYPLNLTIHAAEQVK